ncbi:MAG: TPM domain-containing protein [Acidobacteriota bacterium]
MRTWLRWCWIGALALVAWPGWAIEVRDVPKPPRWATDLTGRVPPLALAQFEGVADRVEREKGGQMVLVVVGSLDGKESRPFAAELFNTWEIGRKEANDGVLLFFALDDHKLELLLGDGLDDPLRQAASEGIVHDVIVPRLKAGDLAGAVIEGARQCAERIYQLPATEAAAAPEPLAAAEAVSQTTSGEPVPVSSLPPIFSGEAGTDSRETGGGSSGAAPGIVFAILVLLGGIVGFFFLPRRPPKCCGQAMVLLSEPARGEHLSAGQRMEESLGSVTYAIWSCGRCGRIESRSNLAAFGGYATCSACGFQTASKTRTVLQAATTLSAGSAEVVETCRNCNFRAVNEEVIPRTRPVQRTDRHRASSAAPSPKSPGRSFGGGRTSGGGASGTW